MALGTDMDPAARQHLGRCEASTPLLHFRSTVCPRKKISLNLVILPHRLQLAICPSAPTCRGSGISKGLLWRDVCIPRLLHEAVLDNRGAHLSPFRMTSRFPFRVVLPQRPGTTRPVEVVNLRFNSHARGPEGWILTYVAIYLSSHFSRRLRFLYHPVMYYRQLALRHNTGACSLDEPARESRTTLLSTS